MKCITVISGVAFAVICLAAVFLFIRNYPNDRWFSVVFIVAGGVLAWCVAEAEAEAESVKMATVDKIEYFYKKPAAITDTTNEDVEHHHHGSNARQEQEGTEGGGERMGDDEGK
jgi:hypothetical protein